MKKLILYTLTVLFLTVCVIPSAYTGEMYLYKKLNDNSDVVGLRSISVPQPETAKLVKINTAEYEAIMTQIEAAKEAAPKPKSRLQLLEDRVGVLEK